MHMCMCVQHKPAWHQQTCEWHNRMYRVLQKFRIDWVTVIVGNPSLSHKLKSEKQNAKEFIKAKGFSYFIEDDSEFTIEYPILKSPVKIKSHSFDKTPIFKGVLAGIKGQYLILDSGDVLNIRNYSGYKVEIKIKQNSIENGTLF